MTNHRKIKNIIYKLKRKWGAPLRIFRESVSNDFTTGSKTLIILAEIAITKAVILPRRIKADFAYDLSYIAANKNFTYGGTYTKSQRKVLIDADDISAYGSIAKDDFIEINDRRYAVMSSDPYDNNGIDVAYMLTIKELEASPDV